MHLSVDGAEDASAPAFNPTSAPGPFTCTGRRGNRTLDSSTAISAAVGVHPCVPSSSSQSSSIPAVSIISRRGDPWSETATHDETCPMLPNCSDTVTCLPAGDKTLSNLQDLGSKRTVNRSGSRGGGCSVLIDKSIDLIELTEDAALDDTEVSRVASCSCASRPTRKWIFSRHKCKSLDCTNRTAIKSPIMQGFIGKPRSLEFVSSSPVPECGGSLSTVFSGTSSGGGGGVTSDLLRPSSVHCDMEIIGYECLDDDFRVRSFSLTPTVNMAVFETESSSDGEVPENYVPASGELTPMRCSSSLATVSAPLLSQPSLPFSPSAAQLSLASNTTDSGAAICKICHMTSKDGDPLISPCRCSGTMQYIHCGCLMRWLEISSKKSRKPPSCELCQYQYHWHKKFKVRHWQFPHCSRQDKVLHLLFFISVLIMVACATITIMCFKQDKGTKVDPDRTELTESEIVTLVCGVLFFLAFFVAMYVEVKARNTIYKLLVRFIYLNQQWYIDEYEKKDSAPVSV